MANRLIPLPQGVEGQRLVLEVNDRLRRIGQQLDTAVAPAPPPVRPPHPGGGPVTFIQEIPTGTLDGTNVTFTLSHSPARGAVGKPILWFTLNGVLQDFGRWYTLSGSTITMTVAPIDIDFPVAEYMY